MVAATHIQTKKPKKLLYIVIVIVGLLLGWAYVQSGPSRHDKQTTSDLNYIRMQVGKYVVAHKSLPTMSQLTLPAAMQARAAERHYTLALEKDNSKNNGFLQQPSYDFKQCADFVTSTTNKPGNTNDAHTGFNVHHSGTHCFINYAYLYDSRVKP